MPLSPVSDPALLAELNALGSSTTAGKPGGKGVGGATAQAQKRYNELQDGGQMARENMVNLARARNITQSIPTGFLNNLVEDARRRVGLTDNRVVGREKLGALQNQMVMSLRQPGAGSISDSERAAYRQSLFSPNYQPAANLGIINSKFGSEARTLGRAILASKWKGKYGTIDAVAPTGQTFDDAYQNMLNDPAAKAAQNMLSRKTSGPARIKDDADYDKLPSGAHFVGPDGVDRVKP